MKIHIVNSPTFLINKNTFEPVTSEYTGETKHMNIVTLYVGKLNDEQITEMLFEMAQKNGKENIYLYEVKDDSETIRCTFL